MTGDTFLDLCTDMLTRLGELGQGETPSPEDSAFCLRVTNSVLDIWSTERFMLYTVALVTESLIANTQDYTIGPSGATWTAARPVLFQTASVNVAGTFYSPMSILTSKQWEAIQEFGETALVPKRVYLDQNYPNAGVHVHPIPTGSPMVRFTAWSELQQFVAITDLLNFPPGYYEAVLQAVLVDIAPSYGRPQSDPVTVERARDSKSKIMMINAQILGGSLGVSQDLQAPNIGQPEQQQGQGKAQQ